MTYEISVLRRESSRDKGCWQSFSYTQKSDNDTVATALFSLNESGDLSRKIEWECSCLQKKCGACAMVINGRPRLACDARLCEFKDGKISLEPLKKFPVVRDLIVDRSILFENLKTLKLWLNSDAKLSDKDRELAYEASGCIQCGCCLEICPNFYAGGKFFGMATVPVTTRLLTELSKSEYKELAKLYASHTFSGCGKSLACRDICPRKIDTENLMVNANALAVWKRKK